MADRNKKVCKTIRKILLLTGMVFSLSTESILASASALPMANEEEVLTDGQSDVQDALSVEDGEEISVENSVETPEEVPDEPIGEQEESENVNSPEESVAVEEGLEWEDAPLEFYEAQEDGLYQFLCRLYEKILQRPGDPYLQLFKAVILVLTHSSSFRPALFQQIGRASCRERV